MEAGLISIPHAVDARGSLGFIELEKQLPFAVRNVFFIHHVPIDAVRGQHANAASHELIIAVQGSVRITLNKKDVFLLNSPTQGLLLPAGNWLEMDQFSSDALCLVLSSEPYDAGEKITRFEP